MYKLPFAIVILMVIGIVLLFFQFEPWERGKEVLVLSLSVTAFVLAALCIVGLLFARAVTCRVLGGTWLDNGSVHQRAGRQRT